MSADNFSNIEFDLPMNQSNAIKVIGVGGGGSNAVNYMLTQGINGVDFVICNTDAQALQNSDVPCKIQLGASLTEGLGAGANPEIGEQSALESEQEIKEMLGSNTKMVFINAGMGGGTGTGAAPVIAKFAKEMDLLTIGVVTIPFAFEGKTRNEQAQAGIQKLREYVDSLIVINNNKLREVYGNLGFKAGFSKADEVLATASRGIAEVITHHYTQNIDLRDAKTVLANSGTAIMGSAKASGANRAQEAVGKALDSPLLNDNRITGAKNVLLLIVSGREEITIDEIGEINDFIQEEARTNVNIIMGIGEDEALGDAVAVTIVATGFNADQQFEINCQEPRVIRHTLEGEQKATHDFSVKNELQVETPLVTKAPIDEPKIVHTLEEDIQDEFEPVEQNIVEEPNVVLEEVASEALDEFIITSVKEVETDNRSEVVEEENLDEEFQTALQFDLAIDKPIEQTFEVKKAPIEEELQPVVNTTEEPEIVVSETVVEDKANDEQVYFTLEDEPEEEITFERKHEEPVQEIEDKVEEEMDIQMFVKSEKAVEEPLLSREAQKQEREINPLNLTISELAKRAEQRKRSMQSFNHKFNSRINSKNIDDIEKQPAYKRMGVELDDTPMSDEAPQSKTKLSTDDNNDIQLRSNNSFLHDNVD